MIDRLDATTHEDDALDRILAELPSRVATIEPLLADRWVPPLEPPARSDRDVTEDDLEPPGIP